CFTQAGRLGQVADMSALSVQEQFLHPVRANTAHPGRQAVLGQCRSDLVKALCVANELRDCVNVHDLPRLSATQTATKQAPWATAVTPGLVIPILTLVQRRHVIASE